MCGGIQSFLIGNLIFTYMVSVYLSDFKIQLWSVRIWSSWLAINRTWAIDGKLFWMKCNSQIMKAPEGTYLDTIPSLAPSQSQAFYEIALVWNSTGHNLILYYSKSLPVRQHHYLNLVLKTISSSPLFLLSIPDSILIERSFCRQHPQKGKRSHWDTQVYFWKNNKSK